MPRPARSGSFVHGRDAYAPEDIEYAFGFYPPLGLMKTLPNLKAVFSLGAGVDGFLRDPDYPRTVPLVRFVDRTLAREMAQYVVLHVLMHHREQRACSMPPSASASGASNFPAATPKTRAWAFWALGELGALRGRAAARSRISRWRAGAARRKSVARHRELRGRSEAAMRFSRAATFVVVPFAADAGRPGTY